MPARAFAGLGVYVVKLCLCSGSDLWALLRIQAHAGLDQGPTRPYYLLINWDPILRIPQRRRCSQLERFKIEENALSYSWRCQFLQRWRCNSRS
jgi:hypothetical protein